MSLTLLIETLAGISVLLAGYYFAWRFIRSRPEDAKRLSSGYMISSWALLPVLLAAIVVALLNLLAK